MRINKVDTSRHTTILTGGDRTSYGGSATVVGDDTVGYLRVEPVATPPVSRLLVPSGILERWPFFAVVVVTRFEF